MVMDQVVGDYYPKNQAKEVFLDRLVFPAQDHKKQTQEMLLVWQIKNGKM